MSQIDAYKAAFMMGVLMKLDGRTGREISEKTGLTIGRVGNYYYAGKPPKTIMAMLTTEEADLYERAVADKVTKGRFFLNPTDGVL